MNVDMDAQPQLDQRKEQDHYDSRYSMKWVERGVIAGIGAIVLWLLGKVLNLL
jgi:hypothetical protein